ncbi:hypothetical protein ABKN59_008117 [Abortiporus biennis]
MNATHSSRLVHDELAAALAQIEVSRTLLCFTIGAWVWDVLHSLGEEALILVNIGVRMITTAISIFAMLIFTAGPVDDCNTLIKIGTWTGAFATSCNALLFFLRTRIYSVPFFMIGVPVIVAYDTPLASTYEKTCVAQGINVQNVPMFDLYVSTGPVMMMAHDTVMYLAVGIKLTKDRLAPTQQRRGGVVELERCLRAFFSGSEMGNLAKTLVVSGQVYYLITATASLTTLICVLSPSIPEIVRHSIPVHNIMIHNNMACKLYRRIKLGGITDGSPKFIDNWETGLLARNSQSERCCHIMKIPSCDPEGIFYCGRLVIVFHEYPCILNSIQHNFNIEHSMALTALICEILLPSSGPQLVVPRFSMSDVDEIAAELISINSYNYTQLSANLICLYDLLITFDLERERIWPLRLSTMKLLFLLNRYHRLPRLVLDGLLTYPPGEKFTNVSPRHETRRSVHITYHFCRCRCWQITRIHLSPCNLGTILPGVIDLISFTITAVFSALRILAIWGYSRKAQFLCLIILAVGLTTPCFNIYRMTIIYSLSYRIHLPHIAICQMALLTRSFAVLCEFIVLIATWWKTYTVWMESKRIGFRAPITTLLLRDGTVYFGLMMVMNVIAVILDCMHSPGGNQATAYFTAFSSILISRMMLNLRGGILSSTKDNRLSNLNGDTNIIMSTSTSQVLEEDRTTIIFGHIGMPVSYSTSDFASDESMELVGIDYPERQTQRQMVDSPLSVGLLPSRGPFTA